MSMLSAREFLAKVGSDESFRQGLAGCRNRGEQHAFARAAGFDFTADEVRAAGNDLQDADLDAVSGGSCCGATCEPEVRQTCGYDLP